MQPPQAFLITTFDPELGKVEETVREAILRAGFRIAHYPDSIRPGAQRALSVFDNIRDADLIVADVSGQNPNVLYELGFAQALWKPTILLVNSRSGSRLPSDLAGLEYIAYDPADLRGLSDRVRLETTGMNLPRSA